jgi:hypothetical protein
MVTEFDGTPVRDAADLQLRLALPPGFSDPRRPDRLVTRSWYSCVDPPYGMTTSITAERTEWAAPISAAWQKSVDSIIETGRLLLAAKADPKMQHGEWGTMVESDLPFNRHTAHKLMPAING